jgi:hypothetical protein
MGEKSYQGSRAEDPQRTFIDEDFGRRPPQVRQLFTTHVHDPVALAVGATRETSEAARRR